MYRRIKGTRDILPDEVGKRRVLEQEAIRLFEAYNYLPIITPVFEQTELFVRGIGEASEIVQKEMYTFEDRGGRSLTLRPEGTAPVVRAYIENNLMEMRHPLKLYYIMPMYRYERPQKGRLREFWQIGIEVFGAPGPDVDAEVIFLMVEYFRRLGIENINTYINTIGCRQCRPAYIEKLKEYLSDHLDELCDDCRFRYSRNPLRVFDCKEEGCAAVLAGAPFITDNVCSSCKDHFKGLMDFLENMNVDFEINKKLVRGFDYYEKTTFEVTSELLGAQNAIGGGGRYDPLVKDCGGPDIPGIGFAIGVERLLLQLEEEGLIPETDLSPVAFVVFTGDDMAVRAHEIYLSLAQSGIKAEYDYAHRSLKAQFKQANRQKARYAVIVAPEELAQNAVKIRDMETGEETLVPVKEVSDRLKAMMEEVN